MKVLVTGGCGFIGSHLVRSLVADSVDVHVMDNARCKAPPGVGFVLHTVTNYDACLRSLAGVHVIYHLAARSDWAPTPQHPARVFTTNARGTVEVLTAALQAGAQKVIFTSSYEVYGNVLPNVEGGPCLPVTLMGASKLAAETACQYYSRLGLEVVVLRLFEVWGDGGHSAVEQFAQSGAEIEGSGEQTRDFVHVNDVVTALRSAYHWDSGLYNIGTGVETSIEGLWRLMRRNDEPTFIPPREDEIVHSCADLTRVSEYWQARRTLPLDNTGTTEVL